MASQKEALCRIRIKQSASQARCVFHEEKPISAQHAHGDNGSLAAEKKTLFSCSDTSRVPGEIRREWASLMIDEIGKLRRVG
jgi:hypothetical protein